MTGGLDWDTLRSFVYAAPGLRPSPGSLRRWAGRRTGETRRRWSCCAGPPLPGRTRAPGAGAGRSPAPAGDGRRPARQSTLSRTPARSSARRGHRVARPRRGGGAGRADRSAHRHHRLIDRRPLGPGVEFLELLGVVHGEVPGLTRPQRQKVLGVPAAARARHPCRLRHPAGRTLRATGAAPDRRRNGRGFLTPQRGAQGAWSSY